MKTSEQKLKDFTKANCKRKMLLAKKAGFDDVETYRNSLKDLVVKRKEFKEEIIPQIETKQLTQTELIRKFEEAQGKDITVRSYKKLDPQELFKKFEKIYEETIPKLFLFELKVCLLDNFLGQKREFIGFHNNKLDIFGRVYFQENGVHLKVIDVKNIFELEIDGVKYVLK